LRARRLAFVDAEPPEGVEAERESVG
jgi:hypothetical protein